MAGLSMADLPFPEDCYRVDLHSPNFETSEAAAFQDAFKAKGLRRRAKKCRRKRAVRLNALAELLDPEVTPETPQTLASSRYMRDLRIRVIGAVWKLVAEDRTGQVERIDVLKPGWAMSGKDFRKLDPDRLRAEFRADLLRAAKKLGLVSAANSKGFLIAFLHGEHQADCDLLHPHFHLIASGDWIDVVMRLKKLRKYKPTDRVKRPIQRGKQLTKLAYALTYLLKPYWPKKWMGHVSGVGRERRSRRHNRIDEPQHSEVLMWLHQFRLDQTVLKLGVRQIRHGLKLSH